MDRASNDFSVVILAPECELATLAEELLKSLGKRRYERVTVDSTFSLLHRLRPNSPLLKQSTRMFVAEQLRAAAPQDDTLLLGADVLDIRVFTHPEHPVTTAYIAGLAALGASHPYQDLRSAELPVGVRNVFVFDIDHLPQFFVDWLLTHRRRGIEFTVSAGPDWLAAVGTDIDGVIETYGPAAADRYDGKIHLRSLLSLDEEREAILEACANNGVDAVYCVSHTLQNDLELDCLFRKIPFRASPVTSLLSSESINALFSYLGWVVYEDEPSLETLFTMIGGNLAHYARYAAKARLSKMLSIGCVSAQAAGEPQGPFETRLAALGDLVINSRMQSSGGARVQYFSDWAHQHIDGFEPHQVATLLFRSGINNDSTSLADLRRLLYQGLSDDSSNAVQITSLNQHDLPRSGSAWLALGRHGSFMATARSVVEPLLTGPLTISTVATEQ